MITVAEQLSRQLEEVIQDRSWEHGERFLSRQEISSRYNVSPATVSNALKILSKKQLIRTIPGKGVFIVDPAQVQAGSKSNESSANKKDRPAYSIGLIGKYVPSGVDIQVGGTNLLSNEPIINGIWGAAIENKSNLVLLPNARDEIDIDQIRELNVDGVILLGGFSQDELIKMRMSQIPAIAANRGLYGSPINFIDYDNVGMIQDWVARMASFGHQRLGFISHTTTVEGYNDFLEACCIQAMLKHGISTEGFDDYWRIGELDLHSHPVRDAYRHIGRSETEALLDLPQPPTVIYCYRSSLVGGVCETLDARGLRIGKDISLVVGDSNLFSSYEFPGQTLGALLVEHLLKTIENPNHYIQEMLVPQPFVDRGSVCSLK